MLNDDTRSFVQALPVLRCGPHSLDLTQPQVMGILNVTPDSFSDGGRFAERDQALRHAEQMLRDGAAIIDVGGESTRPGAAPVSEQQELDRVLPVLECLVKELGALVSLDTSTPAVMREGARLGAGLINDVRSLRREGALAAAAETGLPVCLMHMQGEPGNMQTLADYDDVVTAVTTFLAERIEACEAAGIARHQLILDPGFGFAKTLAHNLSLLNRLATLQSFGLPILAGMSRKRMLGEVTGRETAERLPAGLAAHLLALSQGATILRVHDVREMADAVALASAVWQAS